MSLLFFLGVFFFFHLRVLLQLKHSTLLAVILERFSQLLELVECEFDSFSTSDLLVVEHEICKYLMVNLI